MNRSNLYSIFKSNNLSHLKDRFVISGDGKVQYTYFDLHTACEKLSQYLYSVGLSKGDRLIAKTAKSIESVILYLSCLRAGIIYIPLNPAYTMSELSYFIEDSKPKACVFDNKDMSESEGYLVFSLSDLVRESRTSIVESTLEEPCFDDTAVVIYTSGTTGKPKGAMLSHRNLYTNGMELCKFWGFSQKDVLLHTLPIFHVHGLFFALHCVLLSSASMIFVGSFNTEQVIKHLKSSTVFMGVPTYYTRLLNDDRLNKDITSKMRLFTSGSAPILQKTINDFMEKTGHKILERYGMSETGVIASNPLDGERRVGTVGVPLGSTSVRLIDSGVVLTEPERIGSIEVKGGSIFSGYLNRTQKSREFFTDDGYFITGDLGVLDSKGYISIVGRNKDLIITGGMNVYPKEVEFEIDNIEGVAESAVIGVPHSDFGEAVTAFVVPLEEPLFEGEIIRVLKQKLANYKIPKTVIFIDKLPRNTMSKVQKNALRDNYLKVYERAGEVTETPNETPS